MKNLVKLSSVVTGYKVQRFVWVTSPKYEISKLPIAAAKYNQNNIDYFRYNADAVKQLQASIGESFNFLDAWHLTGTCLWANCTDDGAHRSAFVNHMKARILLTWLC